MLSKKAAKYCARAIVDYLNGDFDKFNRLVSIAMKMNNEYSCSNCGNLTVPAKFYINKYKYKKVEICTSCGQIAYKKEVIRKGRQVC